MTRMNSVKASVLACSLACLGIGCSSDHAVNVGDGTPVSVDKSKLSSYAYSWDGYVEAYTFPSGTDRVRVVLDANGNGHLQVGDGDISPPPTNPDIAYPPAAVAYSQQLGGAEIPNSFLYDGFGYPVSAARVESERIELGVDPASAFTDWCALQTSNEFIAGWSSVSGTIMSYSCLPNGGSCFANGNDTTQGCNLRQLVDASGGGSYTCGTTPVDCGKANLCMSACSCTAAGCTSTSSTYNLVSLDAALSDDGRELVGTIVLMSSNQMMQPGAQGHTIRLKR